MRKGRRVVEVRRETKEALLLSVAHWNELASAASRICDLTPGAHSCYLCLRFNSEKCQKGREKCPLLSRSGICSGDQPIMKAAHKAFYRWMVAARRAAAWMRWFEANVKVRHKETEE